MKRQSVGCDELLLEVRYCSETGQLSPWRTQFALGVWRLAKLLLWAVLR